MARAAPLIGGVRLELTGAKAVTQTDNAALYSLYGDTDGTVPREMLPAGSYTLSGSAYAEADGGSPRFGSAVPPGPPILWENTFPEYRSTSCSDLTSLGE